MKERGILFSAPMVRALLDGRKTQTRRVMEPQPAHLQHHEWRGDLVYDGEHRLWCWKRHTFENLWDAHIREPERRELSVMSPFGIVGDQLWVREEHYRYGHWEQVDGTRMRTRTGRQRWRFVADLDEVRFDPPAEFRKGRHHKDPATPAWHKRIARFMPRAFSRITLRIAEIRVQLLQEIGEDDARAEGVEPFREAITIYPSRDVRVSSTFNKLSYRPAFIELWDSINFDRASWSSNPWCWCLTFRRLPAVVAK